MSSVNITQDEAAIYDRQIRLWGLSAQQRIRNAHILIVGMHALSDEVCKNVALAGVDSITLLDHTLVDQHDIGAQFFLSEDNVGQNRAAAAAPALQALNPHVKIIVDEDIVTHKDDAFFERFDIVCLVRAEINTLLRVDRLRRAVNKPFYAADAFGWFGYIFCDLGKHTYTEEKEVLSTDGKSKERKTVSVQKTEEYVSLEESLAKDWSVYSPRKLKNQISSLSLIIHVLLKIQQEMGEIPKHDTELILKKKTHYLNQMGVSDTGVLADDLFLQAVSLLDTEMAPVAAIVGGVLAQEMIKVLSAKELPVQNWFYYNGLQGSGLIHQI